MGEEKKKRSKSAFLKKGTSGGEQARTHEVRGKDIIGTVFGDILLKHSKVNYSCNKRVGTKVRALMYISDQ